MKKSFSENGLSRGPLRRELAVICDRVPNTSVTLRARGFAI